MILFILAIGPALLLLHFFYVRDLHEREAAGRIVKVFFLGMLAVLPAIALESIYQAPPEMGLVGIAINAFLLIALPEELSKLWLFRLYVEKHRSYNEVYDGIIYMVAISLGFATVENLAYVYGSGPDAMAVALSAFPHIAGTASALMGFIQMALSASATALVGAYLTDTPVPMLNFMVLVTFLALLRLLSLSTTSRSLIRTLPILLSLLTLRRPKNGRWHG